MDRLLQMARKDVLDSARDRELYVIGVLFLLIGVGIGYFVGDAGQRASDHAVAVGSLGALIFIGSIAAISLSYNQIVGKRNSGELRVLLSLPFSRFETVYGTALARWALMMGLSSLTVIIGALLATAMGATVAVKPVVGTLISGGAIMAVFVSLSVGLSAASANTTRAGAGAFGLFILFLARMWEAAPIAVRFAINGFSMPSAGTPKPTWAKVWGQIAPIAGMRNAVAETFPDLTSVLGGWAPGVSNQPVYAEPWFGALVVLAWIVLPVTLGYLKLRGADL